MSKILVQTYMVRSMSRGVHGPKPITSGPTGSVLVLGPDQKSRTGPGPNFFRNIGPTRTRAELKLVRGSPVRTF